MAAKDAIVGLVWERTEDDEEKEYTTGCVIKKDKDLIFVLTCAHHLRALFPELTDEELQQKCDSIGTNRNISVGITFFNNKEKDGFLMTGCITDNLCLVGVKMDESLKDIPYACFKEDTTLVPRDHLWTYHDRAMLTCDEDDNVVVYYLLRKSYSSGLVSNSARIIPDSPSPYVEYWLPLLGPGSYGAPIFNGDNIVAVHSKEVQGVQFGVHVSTIKDFFCRKYEIQDQDNKSMKEILSEVGA